MSQIGKYFPKYGKY